ncbi:hypothetical protein SHELI_v1c06760 [Spiroplasma helicoides]|uniref:Uncharacterized protein n=1 Tax=Spiroplasma helicoides TaxID=216938 RepID=A0A1B3SL33_9MOLU|nr:hypothetical protein [Spiroplasma helicoides]AOG60627.1 hypothetical protein SHELI_v1c06760 [Spiroplasma helicoides]
MKKSTTRSFFLGIFLIIFTFVFMLIANKRTIYSAQLIIQQKVDEEGEIKINGYLFCDKKINLAEVEYFKIDYINGYELLSNKYLYFDKGIIALKNVDLINLDPNKNRVILYGNKINLLNYLISSLY